MIVELFSDIIVEGLVASYRSSGLYDDLVMEGVVT